MKPILHVQYIKSIQEKNAINNQDQWTISKTFIPLRSFTIAIIFYGICRDGHMTVMQIKFIILTKIKKIELKLM